MPFPTICTRPRTPGDDFTWENAGSYFEYLDALIAAVNADPQGRFEAFYSTPADYLRSVVTSVPRWPSFAGDLFPYNDDAAVSRAAVGNAARRRMRLCP
jgi:hypothetical protein